MTEKTLTPAPAGWRVIISSCDYEGNAQHLVCHVVGWLPLPDEPNLPQRWEPVVFDPELAEVTPRRDAVALIEDHVGPAAHVLLPPGEEFDPAPVEAELYRRDAAEMRVAMNEAVEAVNPGALRFADPRWTAQAVDGSTVTADVAHPVYGERWTPQHVLIRRVDADHRPIPLHDGHAERVVSYSGTATPAQALRFELDAIAAWRPAALAARAALS